MPRYFEKKVLQNWKKIDNCDIEPQSFMSSAVKRFLAEGYMKKEKIFTLKKHAFDKWAAVLTERKTIFCFDFQERNVKLLAPNHLYNAFLYNDMKTIKALSK